MKFNEKDNIVFWDDRDIIIGKDWDKTIKQNLAESNIGLLLISPSFLESEYIKNIEVPKLIEKGILPVGLIKVKTSQLKKLTGLEKKQLFRLTGSFYADCTDDEVVTEQFLDRLVEEIELRLQDESKEKTSSNKLLQKLDMLQAKNNFDSYHAGNFQQGRARETDLQSVNNQPEKITNSQPILDTLLNWVKQPNTLDNPVAPLFAIMGEFGMGKTFTCRMLTTSLL